jgi:hypothetical protein
MRDKPTTLAGSKTCGFPFSHFVGLLLGQVPFGHRLSQDLLAGCFEGGLVFLDLNAQRFRDGRLHPVPDIEGPTPAILVILGKHHGSQAHDAHQGDQSGNPQCDPESLHHCLLFSNADSTE